MLKRACFALLLPAVCVHLRGDEKDRNATPLSLPYAWAAGPADSVIYLPPTRTAAGGPGMKFAADLHSFVLPNEFNAGKPAGPSRLPVEFWRDQASANATVKLPAGTSFYGEGEVTGPLLRNGTTVRLWNTDNYEYKRDEGKRLYQSHPWVLAVEPDGSADGILFDTTWDATIAIQGSEITCRSEGPPFQVATLHRARAKEVVEALAEITGKIELPPLWALGYQQCRYSYHPDSMVRDIADTFRSKQIPCDVIWMDIHYMDGYRIFTFNPKEFPDPKGLNGYLHAKGFKSIWMIDPGVKAEPGYAVYDSGTAQDVWVHDASGKAYVGSVWAGPSVFPDFTRPETRTWWAGLYHDFMAQGVDGIWNDMNEPAVFDGPDKTMPKDNWHRGGRALLPGPHAQYHNVYGRLMVWASRQGIQEANPEKRPFVLSRANFLGGQRFAATWTGDNASTEAYMKAAIPMSLNLSLSGQPFNGPDLGGFSGEAEGELWGQWVGFGTFFPFCRAHADRKANQKEPWAFGPKIEAAARIAIERRYRLLPYLYTLFQQAATKGSPIMEPAFFADPTNPAMRAEHSEFLLGDDLLVVPQWAAGEDAPAGIWRSVSLVPGDRADHYQADVRIRGGAIVPLGKVVQNTTEKSLDPLTLLVCLDEKGEARGTLYEDAGEGYAYRKGDYLLTTYSAQWRNDRLQVRIEKSEGRMARPDREVVVRVVAVNGTEQGSGREVDGISLAMPGGQALIEARDRPGQK